MRVNNKTLLWGLSVYVKSLAHWCGLHGRRLHGNCPPNVHVLKILQNAPLDVPLEDDDVGTLEQPSVRDRFQLKPH